MLKSGCVVHQCLFDVSCLDAHCVSSSQPAFFSATNALYLITSNLSLSACSTHVLLYHWADLKPFFLSLNPWNKSEYAVHDAVCLVLSSAVYNMC